MASWIAFPMRAVVRRVQKNWEARQARRGMETIFAVWSTALVGFCVFLKFESCREVSFYFRVFM